MAGELPPYSNWIRQQACAGCLGPGPCDPHHAHCGTTYDPDERPPTKSAGPKRGRGQRSHDKWLIPMHMRCHRQFTDSSGPYRDWDNERRDSWEREQVRIHRERYAAEQPATSVAATSNRTTRKRATGSGERERVLEKIVDWAGARRLKAEEHQLIHDLINDLRAEGF